MAGEKRPAASDEELQKGSKKRARKNSDDGTSSKKRGRPRVETQDENATQRRRTQIRLAQRAYRQRKEETISELKQRVNELESAMKLMGQSLLTFNDTATSSDIAHLRPNLAQELQRTVQLFVKLNNETVQRAAEPGGEEDEVLDDEEPQSAVEAPRNPLAVSPRAQSQTPISATPQLLMPPQRGMQSHSSSQQTYYQPTSEHNHHDMSFGYQEIFNNHNHATRAQDTVSNFLAQLPTTHQPSDGGMLSFDMMPNGLGETYQMQQYHVNRASIPSPPSLTIQDVASPFTYSYNETTFARRLKRRAIERAFKLLSTSYPNANSRVKRVFQIPLMTHTQEQVLAKFKTLLKRTIHESLDFWQWPFLHIGGAGTHYPERDAYGNVMPSPNCWTVQRIGPTPRNIQLQNGEGVVQQVDMDLAGFDGQWFDATDVQGYLAEKGISIDPQASYADIVIDQPPPPHIPGSTGSPLGMDLAFSKRNYLPPDMAQSNRGSISAPSESAPSLTFGSSSGPGSTSGPQTPLHHTVQGEFGEGPGLIHSMPVASEMGNLNKPVSIDPYAHQHPQFKVEDSRGALGGAVWPAGAEMGQGQRLPPGKRMVTVDVAKFIDGIINNGVCLGRAPGFRRWHVDQSLMDAIINAY